MWMVECWKGGKPSFIIRALKYMFMTSERGLRQKATARPGSLNL